MSEREAAFNALAEPQKRGDAAEAIIKAEFLLRDIPVLVPENDNEPYDIVIELDGVFHRVQCKTGYSDEPGRIKFETRSTRVKSTGYERETYRGKADFFAVYNPVLDVVYLVDVDDAPISSMNIRWTETRNNQTASVNWHADLVLDARLKGP